LWQLLYFGVCLAAVALVELVVVVLLLSLFLCLFAEPEIMTELQTKRLQPSSSSSALARSLFFLMMMSYWMLLSYLKISPFALSPVPIFGSSVLMTDFAVRRFLIFHNLFPIFIPKRYTFGILMPMRQILLTIMHPGSIMT
jgi:hypothetical protein